MTCQDCEQLFDAYLDGQLADSLRLELDAHRLRCRHCQQTLAMLEAVGHVLSADAEMPALSGDFTDRVLQSLGTSPARTLRFPRWRTALGAAAAVQVAAVLLFVFVWRIPGGSPNARVSPQPLAVSTATDETRADGFRAVRELIVDRIDDRLWDMHTAGRRLTGDMLRLANYLNLTLPEDYVRESEKVADANPLQVLFDALNANPPEETDAAAPSADLHSL